MKVVVIGAGILGQTHALIARERGHDVTVLERSERPLGASVRNFGTLWPIGCRPGSERRQALRGVARWRELGERLGIDVRTQGSLSLAYREEARQVLDEFAAQADMADAGFELLAPDDAVRRFPAVQPEGLKGALYSDAEAVVPPATALARLAEHLTTEGCVVRFNTVAMRVHEDAVECSDGSTVPFDRLVIAAGDDMRTLFPRELAAADLQRCKLQMMRTVPQPRGFDLGAILVSDLTLCHYPAFGACPSRAPLQERLDRELPRHREHGVHVIAAQHPDGSLVLGDSHEYTTGDFAPELRTDIDDLVLEALRGFVRLPELRITARWPGVYLKSTTGTTQVVLQPQERVEMVTAMGGLGMTLSWGLAERTVSAWQEQTV